MQQWFSRQSPGCIEFCVCYVSDLPSYRMRSSWQVHTDMPYGFTAMWRNVVVFVRLMDPSPCRSQSGSMLLAQHLFPLVYPRNLQWIASVDVWIVQPFYCRNAPTRWVSYRKHMMYYCTQRPGCIRVSTPRWRMDFGPSPLNLFSAERLAKSLELHKSRPRQFRVRNEMLSGVCDTLANKIRSKSLHCNSEQGSNCFF